MKRNDYNITCYFCVIISDFLHRIRLGVCVSDFVVFNTSHCTNIDNFISFEGAA